MGWYRSLDLQELYTIKLHVVNDYSIGTVHLFIISGVIFIFYSVLLWFQPGRGQNRIVA